MVYTDGIHLASNDINELHAFAKKIGLKRCWFQGTRKHKYPHYDLTTPHKTEIAVQNGAILITSRLLIDVLRSTESVNHFSNNVGNHAGRVSK